MTEKCTACYGSGRWGMGGASGDATSVTRTSRQCDRCIGTGREPMEEVVYVRMLNARVAARAMRAVAA